MNNLAYLTEILFGQLERLSNPELSGDELTAEIHRSKAVADMGAQITAGWNLALKAKMLADASISGEFSLPRALLEE